MFTVHLRDGHTIREADGVEWKHIPLNDIISLQLHRPGGQVLTLVVDGSKVKLLQLKRNILTLHGTNNLVERVIGFIWEDRLAVKLVVDESSGNVGVTVEEKNEKASGWHRL